MQGWIHSFGCLSTPSVGVESNTPSFSSSSTKLPSTSPAPPSSKSSQESLSPPSPSPSPSCSSSPYIVPTASKENDREWERNQWRGGRPKREYPHLAVHHKDETRDMDTSLRGTTANEEKDFNTEEERLAVRDPLLPPPHLTRKRSRETVMTVVEEEEGVVTPNAPRDDEPPRCSAVSPSPPPQEVLVSSSSLRAAATVGIPKLGMRECPPSRSSSSVSSSLLSCYTSLPLMPDKVKEMIGRRTTSLPRSDEDSVLVTASLKLPSPSPHAPSPAPRSSIAMDAPLTPPPNTTPKPHLHLHPHPSSSSCRPRRRRSQRKRRPNRARTSSSFSSAGVVFFPHCTAYLSGLLNGGMGESVVLDVELWDGEISLLRHPSMFEKVVEQFLSRNSNSNEGWKSTQTTPAEIHDSNDSNPKENLHSHADTVSGGGAAYMDQAAFLNSISLVIMPIVGPWDNSGGNMEEEEEEEEEEEIEQEEEVGRREQSSSPGPHTASHHRERNDLRENPSSRSPLRSNHPSSSSMGRARRGVDLSAVEEHRELDAPVPREPAREKEIRVPSSASGVAFSPRFRLFRITSSDTYSAVLPLLAQLLASPKVRKLLLHSRLLYRLLFLFLGTERVQLERVLDVEVAAAALGWVDTQSFIPPPHRSNRNKNDTTTTPTTTTNNNNNNSTGESAPAMKEILRQSPSSPEGDETSPAAPLVSPNAIITSCTDRKGVSPRSTTLHTPSRESGLGSTPAVHSTEDLWACLSSHTRESILGEMVIDASHVMRGHVERHDIGVTNSDETNSPLGSVMTSGRTTAGPSTVFSRRKKAKLEEGLPDAYFPVLFSGRRRPGGQSVLANAVDLGLSPTAQRGDDTTTPWMDDGESIHRVGTAWEELEEDERVYWSMGGSQIPQLEMRMTSEHRRDAEGTPEAENRHHHNNNNSNNNNNNNNRENDTMTVSRADVLSHGVVAPSVSDLTGEEWLLRDATFRIQNDYDRLPPPSRHAEVEHLVGAEKGNSASYRTCGLEWHGRSRESSNGTSSSPPTTGMSAVDSSWVKSRFVPLATVGMFFMEKLQPLEHKPVLPIGAGLLSEGDSATATGKNPLSTARTILSYVDDGISRMGRRSLSGGGPLSCMGDVAAMRSYTIFLCEAMSFHGVHVSSTCFRTIQDGIVEQVRILVQWGQEWLDQHQLILRQPLLERREQTLFGTKTAMMTIYKETQETRQERQQEETEGEENDEIEQDGVFELLDVAGVLVWMERVIFHIAALAARLNVGSGTLQETISVREREVVVVTSDEDNEGKEDTHVKNGIEERAKTKNKDSSPPTEGHEKRSSTPTSVSGRSSHPSSSDEDSKRFMRCVPNEVAGGGGDSVAALESIAKKIHHVRKHRPLQSSFLWLVKEIEEFLSQHKREDTSHAIEDMANISKELSNPHQENHNQQNNKKTHAFLSDETSSLCVCVNCRNSEFCVLDVELLHQENSTLCSAEEQQDSSFRRPHTVRGWLQDLLHFAYGWLGVRERIQFHQRLSAQFSAGMLQCQVLPSDWILSHSPNASQNASHTTTATTSTVERGCPQQDGSHMSPPTPQFLYAVHPHWELHTWSSGRIFSSRPNIQNIDRFPIKSAYPLPPVPLESVTLPKTPGPEDEGEESETVGIESKKSKYKGKHKITRGETEVFPYENHPPERSSSLLLPQLPTLTLRHLYVPPPGCVFLAMDYNQIELRIVAHLSQDPMLLSLLQRNEDIIAAIAQCILYGRDLLHTSSEVTPCGGSSSTVGGREINASHEEEIRENSCSSVVNAPSDPVILISMEEEKKKKMDVGALNPPLMVSAVPHTVTERERASVKAIIYGLIYGMGIKKMESAIQTVRKDHTRPERSSTSLSQGTSSRKNADYFDAPPASRQLTATELIDRIRVTFPRMMAYLEETRAAARYRKQVQTLCGTRYLSSESNPFLRQQRAVALAVQGSAADVVQSAMAAVHRCRLKYLSFMPVCPFALSMVVHDELIFVVAAPAVDLIWPGIQKTMEQQAEVLGLRVPLKVKVRIGDSLGTLKEVE